MSPQTLPFNPVSPPGSWILVTGVNGYVASHVADQLLQRGYKVRGTVRDPSKAQWTETLFREKYGQGAFELVRVEDMTVPGAFDHAVKGVSGITHVATVFGHSADLISSVVSANRNLLASASRERTVRRFVYTSSSEAATFSSLHEHKHSKTRVGVDTWNEEVLRRIREPSPKAGFDTYAASKTLGEQAVWEWAEEQKPGFVVNTVLPSVCFGASLDPKAQGHASSSAWPASILRNEFDRFWGFLQHVIPTGAYGVDVADVALLHVAGLIHPGVQSERLFAFGGPFTWNGIIAFFRREFPHRSLPGDLPGGEHGVLEIEPAERAEGLLREIGGSGWSGLEETLRRNVEDLV
ncbi:aldehyde reductase II [Aspergillus mulundensis]|uniref:NAD-dependent epimerase/dehydratase domain-containing protein n=1 Tax=Aspergillus mulundensis TaxID=1810919 RepID=A0A3D8RXZ5_9EURO|nr:Uncharacterized protein DSM5745_05785 [Aspergillus mulundensis]RDW78933.1 Uncharacterized protein DSM5745_05785 [Aspergillus mulundensis]